MQCLLVHQYVYYVSARYIMQQYCECELILSDIKYIKIWYHTFDSTYFCYTQLQTCGCFVVTMDSFISFGSLCYNSWPYFMAACKLLLVRLMFVLLRSSSGSSKVEVV